MPKRNIFVICIQAKSKFMQVQKSKKNKKRKNNAKELSLFSFLKHGLLP